MVTAMPKMPTAATPVAKGVLVLAVTVGMVPNEPVVAV
jgi:hypothetical protein